MKPAKRRVIFVLPPGVHLLDLAGPVQTFDSANGCGCNYGLHFIGASPQIPSAVGLSLTGFGPVIPANELDRNDLVIVSGRTLERASPKRRIDRDPARVSANRSSNGR